MLDLQGNVCVTDFGLAHVQGADALTMTGDVLGTLRYMSPEQAAGRGPLLDHRTDIYSLGVTLYELLTLKPAFDQQDRQELLQQILENEPRSLRQLDRKIPRDLETILLKAIAKQPADRYASAEALARDLDRFLESRPIKARRATRVDRTWRWCQRNPMVAALTAAVACLLLVLAIGGPLAALQQKRLALAAENQRRAAEENSTRLKEKTEQLLALVDDLTQTADRLKDVPLTGQIRRKLLTRVLNCFEDLAEEQSTNPNVQLDNALALARMGTLHSQLGQRALSNERYDQAIEILSDLSRQFPDNPEYRQELAGVYVGNLRFSKTLDDQSMHPHWQGNRSRRQRLETARTASTLLAQLIREFPDEPRYLRSHALALGGLSTAMWRLGRYRECRQALRLALERWSQLPNDSFATSEDLLHEANAHYRYSRRMFAIARLDVAEEHRLEADRLNTLARRSAGPATNPAPLSEYSKAEAERMRAEGGFDKESQRYRESIELVEQRVGDFPERVAYRQNLGYLWRLLSGSLLGAGRAEDAEDALARSCTIAEALARDYPGNGPCALELGTVYYRLGTLFHAIQRDEQARTEFVKAAKEFEMVARASSADTGRRNRRLVVMLSTCADPTFRDGPRALELAQWATIGAGDHARFWRILGIAQYESGRYRESIGTLEKTLRLDYGGDCCDRLFLAMAHWQLGEKKTARRWFNEAIDPEKGGALVNEDFTSLDCRRFRAQAEALMAPQDRSCSQGGA